MPSIVSLGEYAIVWGFLIISFLVIGAIALFKK